MSLFSLFHILAIIGSAKDVYLEKFGADPTAIGCLFSVPWSGERDRVVFVPGNIDIYQQVVMFGFCWRSFRYSADLICPSYPRNVEGLNVAYFSSAERPCGLQVISFWSPLTEFLVGHLQERICVSLKP